MLTFPDSAISRIYVDIKFCLMLSVSFANGNISIDVIRLNADGDAKYVGRDLNLKTLMNDLYVSLEKSKTLGEIGCGRRRLRYFFDILSHQILQFEFLISPFAAN